MHEYYGEAAPGACAVRVLDHGSGSGATFFACILHELGHHRGSARGIPIGGITLFLFGGVAELRDEPTSAASEFLMAIAGPMVSLMLGIGFAVVTWTGYEGGWPPSVVLVLGYLAFINLLVLAFNMIPAFPLDGGRVLRSIIWAVTGNLRRAYWVSRRGQAFRLVTDRWGVVQFFTGNWLGGIWSGMIGLFLNAAAQGSYQQVLVRKPARGRARASVHEPAPIAVPSTLDLRHGVEDYVYHLHHKAFPVTSNGHLEGFISTQSLWKMPRSEGSPHGHRGDGARPQELTIAPDADASEVLERCNVRACGAGW